MQNEFMDHEKSSKNRSEVIPLTGFLDIPFELKFPLHLYYSKSKNGSTSHIKS